MRVHVDEAGGDETLLRIDSDVGAGFLVSADEDDPPVANADIGAKPWIAGTVHDTGICDPDVVFVRMQHGWSKTRKAAMT